MSNFKCIVLICIFISSVQCLKILAVFPYNSISHSTVYIPLLEKLREKGHTLKLISFFSLKEELPGDVRLESSEGMARRMYDFTQLKDPNSGRINFLHANVTVGMCNNFLSSKCYADLMQSDEMYDVFLTEYFTTSCYINPFVEKYRMPFVIIQAGSLLSWSDPWLDVPDNPSYIPVLFMNHPRRPTFLDRIFNTVDLVKAYFLYYTVVEPRDDDFLSVCKQCESASSHEIMQRANLVLTYTHFSLLYPRPLPPRIVEVGGMHAGNRQSLPQHIEKWINESEHGVIYFSLGSMIKGHTFPEDKKQMFIKAFSRLPQRVLWKWENDTMTGKTDNIMIEKWMPQFDILCHPNVKVFVAHGGMLGVTEAVHCGVPMVIMPQYGDQFTNAKAVEANGGGLILDYSYLDEESIYIALTTALDPKFNQKAKELSARFKDRPMPPLETAIYWIEYVARHGGAPHLRTAAVGMPLYQYLLLDVIAFLAVILLSIVFIVYYTCRAAFRKLCKRSPKKVKKN